MCETNLTEFESMFNKIMLNSDNVIDDSCCVKHIHSK